MPGELVTCEDRAEAEAAADNERLASNRAKERAKQAHLAAADLHRDAAALNEGLRPPIKLRDIARQRCMMNALQMKNSRTERGSPYPSRRMDPLYCETTLSGAWPCTRSASELGISFPHLSRTPGDRAVIQTGEHIVKPADLGFGCGV